MGTVFTTAIIREKNRFFRIPGASEELATEEVLTVGRPSTRFLPSSIRPFFSPNEPGKVCPSPFFPTYCAQLLLFHRFGSAWLSLAAAARGIQICRTERRNRIEHNFRRRQKRQLPLLSLPFKNLNGVRKKSIKFSLLTGQIKLRRQTERRREASTRTTFSQS